MLLHDGHPSALTKAFLRLVDIVAYFIDKSHQIYSTHDHYDLEHGEEEVQQADERDELHVSIAPPEGCESGLQREHFDMGSTNMIATKALTKHT
jgi:hypothetical protein